MIKFGYLFGLRINTCEVRAFVQIAVNARQSKIRRIVSATMFFGKNVLNMMHRKQ